MRISDWSSDVCSSDLGIRTRQVMRMCWNCREFRRQHWAIRPAAPRAVGDRRSGGAQRRGRRPGGVEPERRRASHRATCREHALPELDLVAEHHHHAVTRTEEHTSELPSLLRISYAVFCLKKNIIQNITLTQLLYNILNIMPSNI